MELKEVVKNRRSVRSYEDTAIPDDKLLRVLEAARLAPSGSNRQAWKFIVVRDKKSVRNSHGSRRTNFCG